MNTCTHCFRTLGFNEFWYIIKKSVKPKGAYKRWIDAGICCEDCFDIGKPTRIEGVK